MLKAWNLQRNAFVEARKYTGMTCFEGPAHTGEVRSVGNLAQGYDSEGFTPFKDTGSKGGIHTQIDEEDHS